jgi:hypothetical protein
MPPKPAAAAGDGADGDEPRKPAPVLDNSSAEMPALFWDSLPEDAESHPDWAAMEALRAECPPEEQAETFKVPAAVQWGGRQ